MNAGWQKSFRDIPNKERLLQHCTFAATTFHRQVMTNSGPKEQEAMENLIPTVCVLGELARRMCKEGYGKNPDEDIRTFERRAESGDPAPEEMRDILVPLDKSVPNLSQTDNPDDALRFLEQEKQAIRRYWEFADIIVARIDRAYGIDRLPPEERRAARQAKAARDHESAYMPTDAAHFHLNALDDLLDYFRRRLLPPEPAVPRPPRAFEIPEEAERHGRRVEWLYRVLVHVTKDRLSKPGFLDNQAHYDRVNQEAFEMARNILNTRFTVEEEKTLCLITGIGSDPDCLPKQWDDFYVHPAYTDLWGKYTYLSARIRQYRSTRLPPPGCYIKHSGRVLKALLEDSEEPLSPYDAFNAYYKADFRGEFEAFFRSYCAATDNDTRFLGFQRDHLIHMDTILMTTHMSDLAWPQEEHLARFAMSVWAICAADCAVYGRLPRHAAKWEKKTRFPKFTGWNYLAASPNFIFSMVSEREKTVGSEIETLIGQAGSNIIRDLMDHLAVLLDLEPEECQTAGAFLCSWLIADSAKAGLPFDGECFLH